MARHLKLYPDLARPRWRTILADLAILACVVGAFALGRAVYRAILTLDAIATATITDGQKAGVAFARVQRDIGSLPLVGPTLHDDLSPVRSIPRDLAATGYREAKAIGHLAALGGIVVVAVPLLILAVTYVPQRVRAVRNWSALDHMLREPDMDASAIETLAGRALYTLPYAWLAGYTPDPLGDWRAGRYDNLARAALAQEGLNLTRYLNRPTAGAWRHEPPNRLTRADP